MASKRFLLLYPDGSRAHIGVAERDDLLISSKICKLNDFSYAYTAQSRTFHSFAEMEPLRENFQPIGAFRRFLQGHFIIETNKDGQRRREHELLETAEGMAIRLQTA